MAMLQAEFAVFQPKASGFFSQGLVRVALEGTSSVKVLEPV